MNRIAIGLFALGAACSSNSSSHGTLIDAPISIDAAPGSNTPSPDAGPELLEMDNYGSVPTFIAYRAGSGAWVVPTSTDGGETYDIAVKNDFVFVAACISTDGTISETEIDALVADAYKNAMQFGCFSDNTGSGSASAAVAVTGTMVQPGVVEMSASATGSAADWAFSIEEPANTTQDLFAIGSAAMLIQRGVALGTAAYPVGAIDLTAGGAAFAPAAISITGMNNDDTFVGYDELETQYEYEYISTTTDPTTITPTPASLVTQDDFEIWDFNTTDPTTARRFETYANATPPFALPAVLTGITFTASTAAWASLDPSWQDVDFSLFAGTQQLPQQASVLAYADWITAKSATSVAFDDSAPGWQAAWSFWKTVAYQPSFMAEQESQTSYESSTLFGASASPAVRRPHSRPSREHGLRAIRRARR